MRDDLLALGDDALAALANVGLVKRARKELESGKAPVIEETEDGTVIARFEDGVVTKLPRGKSLRDAPCTCPSTSVCRHRVALVLAYRSRPQEAEDEAPEAAPRSALKEGVAEAPPKAITDEALRALLPKRVWEKASAARKAGYVADVRRMDRTVALATCTVRFLVPGELSFARCDCAAGGGCEHLALAVWAARAADERDPSASTVVVEIGERAMTESRALDPWLLLGRDVLMEGATHLPAAVAGSFARARTALTEAGLAWPADVLDDLEEQIDAYRARSARYSADRVASLLTETVARGRAGTGDGELPRRSVLGADEAPETKLDHLRLVSLGARLSADGRERAADVILCDPDTATILVLRRRFTYDEKETPENGFGLAHRSIAKGFRLGQVAAGQIVTNVARRRANRALLLGQGGVSRTTVGPQTGDWQELPRPVRVDSVASLDEALRERPPRVLRPRHLADGVVVVPVGAIENVGWSHGEQRLTARLTDPSGGRFTVTLAHRSVAPFATDALADALAGQQPIRFVSGIARRDATGVVVEPLAVVTNRVVVLDLAEGESGARLSAGDGLAAESALAGALGPVASVVADAAHVGLRHLPSRFVGDLDRAAARCTDVGLSRLASCVAELRTSYEAWRVAATAEAETRLTDAWADAAIRVEVLAEQVDTGH